MDISKIRKKIREAREESRKQRPLPLQAEAPESPKDDRRASPVPGPEPASPVSVRPAGPEQEPGLEESRFPAPKTGAEAVVAPVEEQATEVPVPDPEATDDSPDETDFDDYLDRDESDNKGREGHQIKVLAFRLGDEEYAVSMMDMKEVQIFREVTRVPLTPSYVLGIMSLRGKVIPVLDLRKRLGIGGGSPEAPRILVFSMGGEPVGAQVDSISGVITTWTDEIIPSLNTLSEDELRFISGVIRTEHRFVSMLNLDELLNIEMEA